MYESPTATPGPNRTTSDKVMIALRKIIQAIDMNSKKLVKRVGLTGPQLVILQEISRCGEVTARGNRAGGQPEPGNGDRYSGANGKTGISRPETQRAR